MYQSETSKMREFLAPFCKGKPLLDLGAGGDKILPHAISIDLPNQYAQTGYDITQIEDDATKLDRIFYVFSIDTIYSSHLLEDFDNIKEVLECWILLLKPNGYLVLNLPNEKLYKEHCKATGQTYNTNHKHDMSIEFIRDIVKDIPSLKEIYYTGIQHGYNFGVVFQKVG